MRVEHADYPLLLTCNLHPHGLQILAPDLEVPRTPAYILQEPQVTPSAAVRDDDAADFALIPLLCAMGPIMKPSSFLEGWHSWFIPFSSPGVY